MWTTDSFLLDSDLWENGKLHAWKFEACRYSREDSHVMLFKLWSADSEFTWVDPNRCQLHKNTVTDESDNDSAIAKTENLSRFLSWSPRIKIILCLSESHMFKSM